MQQSTRVAAAVLVAGLAAAGTAAFTGTGVTNNADPSQFVGGTVTQTVSGATLSSIVYGFSDPQAKTAIDTATLTFADGEADTKVPTVVFTASSPEPFTCTAIGGGQHTSVCTADSAAQTGASAISITVS